MSYNGSNYVPNKYRAQASAYAGMISTVNGSLGAAIGKLGNASQTLGFNKKGSNDLLTTNVLASSEEVKNIVNSVTSNLSAYSTAVSGKAETLDEEERQLYLNWLRQQKSRKKQNSNTNNSNNSIEIPK